MQGKLDQWVRWAGGKPPRQRLQWQLGFFCSLHWLLPRLQPALAPGQCCNLQCGAPGGPAICNVGPLAQHCESFAVRASGPAPQQPKIFPGAGLRPCPTAAQNFSRCGPPALPHSSPKFNPPGAGPQLCPTAVQNFPGQAGLLPCSSITLPYATCSRPKPVYLQFICK